MPHGFTRRQLGTNHFERCRATRIRRAPMPRVAGAPQQNSLSWNMAFSASDVLVLIPARLAASRLPGKPLADVGGRPMIVEVARRAVAAGIGRVAVATDAVEIADAVRAAGFEAVMTRADHPSGSDRIFEALGVLDPDGAVQVVVNVQGDLPTIAPETIRAALVPLEEGPADIATLTAVITEEGERTDPNVVKVVGTPIGENRLRALYFTRATAPTGEGPLYHHIGLYAYRRAALERFVSLPPSPLEKRERLEQLRALEAGMRIDVAVVDAVPLGVDTPEHLERARALLASNDN
ncbi:3-deoxy-D-manno-octulosonate cytidylyltransferase [Azorhizobium caulinodans ORS 571]|nr:3-deoxy-D-manno-octulosonate cytidylyltransferase [Azorhizobium caulinodans ORS 571]